MHDASHQNVCIINVKYSPNLGDGIISECLEHALIESGEAKAISICDLAGRRDFGDGIDRSRQSIRSILSAMPSKLRELFLFAALNALVALKLKSHYREALENADLVLIGGGQLIADKDMNFPIKLRAALNALPKRDLAVSLYAVGVSASLGHKGISIFKKGLSGRLTAAKVRDEHSKARWDTHFGEPAASIVWDPGLLTSKVYPPREKSKQKTERPLCGLGITNPDTLNTHLDDPQKGMNRADWVSFYVTLIEALNQRGMNVELFSNGPYDDELFIDEVIEAASQSEAKPAQFARAERPLKPEDLAYTIAKYDTLVAHRLHANIIAYSYAIPHVGMGWDAKMQGFFNEVSRSSYLHDVSNQHDALQVADSAQRSLNDPIDRDHIDATQSAIYQQVRTLFDLNKAKSGS